MGRAKCLGAALLLAVAWPAGGHAATKNVDNAKAAAPAGEVVRWVLPWREGVSLRYATESYEDSSDGTARERTRITGTGIIRIRDVRDDGFLQEWVSAGTRYEVLEGEPAGGEVMQGLMDSLADLVLEVELDADGNYRRIANLPEIATRMRPAMRQGMAAAFETQFASAVNGAGAADDAALQAAHAGALAAVDGMVERFVSPEVFEPLLAEDAVRYNDFIGVELTDGVEYSVDVDLDNPLSGGSLPARVTFGIHLRASDPDDVFLEWTTRLDPTKAAEAALAFAATLVDAIPEEARAQMPDGLSVIDTGFVLFRRSTGVVEMLEATRTVRAAGELKVERDRMRLLDGDHQHEWADDGPPTPADDHADAGD